MVCFVMFYKLCERAEQTFSLFLIDKNVPTITLAAWSTVLKTFSLVGSTYTGYYVSKKKVNSMELLSLGVVQLIKFWRKKIRAKNGIDYISL